MKEREIQLNPQWLDNEYEMWYLVPWPDCQVFDEMEGADEGTISTWIDGKPVTFVDPQWLFSEE